MYSILEYSQWNLADFKKRLKYKNTQNLFRGKLEPLFIHSTHVHVCAIFSYVGSIIISLLSSKIYLLNAWFGMDIVYNKGNANLNTLSYIYRTLEITDYRTQQFVFNPPKVFSNSIFTFFLIYEKKNAN